MITFTFSTVLATALFLQFEQSDFIFSVYVSAVHFISGILLVLGLAVKNMRHELTFSSDKRLFHGITTVFTISSFSALVMFFIGTVGLGRLFLFLHIAFSLSFIILAVIFISRFSDHKLFTSIFIQTAILLFVLIGLGKTTDFISSKNTHLEKGDFSPSPGNTVSETYIPAKSLNQSARCGEAGCHPDIYHQWQQSAHRNSSFNNPFYKAAVMYLMETADSVTVRWCASCHDPVMLYSGLMKSTPDMNLPEAEAGITCEVCHGITNIPDITGNANYILGNPIEYPFASHDGFIKTVNKMLIRLKPELHSKNMLNPIHTGEKFCATCHKVSLDEPINHYRWLRGQDEYDAWQASGVSHNAVASFYNPPQPLDCRDCHMYTELSNDKGNDNGRINSHYFPAANTALPFLPHQYNEEWFERTAYFLKENRVTVDIFGAIIDGNLIAPLDEVLRIKPGQDIRLEIVVRTRNIGHSFPGGTIDSNEPWLEVVGSDKSGNIMFSSGQLQSDKTVDPSAHFFRGVLLDGQGEFILKRNPHEWRTTLYNNSIPPGSADVVHYTWSVPAVFEDNITLAAVLNYRKFNRGFSDHALSEPFDLPTIKMASDQIILSATKQTEFDSKGGMRFNDYGIGMFRQGNLEAAKSAFEETIINHPEYADGYINKARVLIREGHFDDAKTLLKKSMEIKPNFSKAIYFHALIDKMNGNYTKAITSLSVLRKSYPNDRNLLKELGQTLFFNEQWLEAEDVYLDVLRIDSEDDDAHYNLIFINNKLSERSKAEFHREQYLKYKPDENARSISQSARLKYPYANNEAQPIHSHQLLTVGTSSNKF